MPVLLYLATFRRNAATTSLSIQATQNALRTELDKVRANCERDPRLAPMIERAFYPLVVTADQVVLGSNWPQRTAWSMSLLETSYFSSAKGGSEFFRRVDEIKREPTDEAAEIAGLLFHCMAMGFQGELRGERRELEARRQELFDKARLGGQGSGGGHRRLTPEAYDRNSSIMALKLPTASSMRIASVALAALLFAWAFGRLVTSLEVKSHVKEMKAINAAIQSEDSL
jgi:type IV/VI secretion system ImpK/VasF family protein